ncbi:MAG: hypothetical protein D6705_15990 [Deltaproteobacteria bacterium]|nr:MAG: hypothetical protein D6705_15990 [Deltaproteobacteria bacterium]
MDLPGRRSPRALRARRTIATAIVAAVTVAYPLVVFATLDRGARPRTVAAILLLVYGLSMAAGRLGSGRIQRASAAARPLWPVLGCLAVAAAIDHPWALYATPVAINLAMLLVFASSLRAGRTPMVERFARIADPDLPPGGVRHCRQVTWVWTVFFALNAIVTFALALLDPRLWALHTGLFAYGAMGILFGAEYAVRKIRQRGAGFSPSVAADEPASRPPA